MTVVIVIPGESGSAALLCLANVTHRLATARRPRRLARLTARRVALVRAARIDEIIGEKLNGRVCSTLRTCSTWSQQVGKFDLEVTR